MHRKIYKNEVNKRNKGNFVKNIYYILLFKINKWIDTLKKYNKIRVKSLDIDSR